MAKNKQKERKMQVYYKILTALTLAISFIHINSLIDTKLYKQLYMHVSETIIIAL